MIPLLRKLFRSPVSPKNRARRKQNYRPQLEGLEERRLLSAVLDLIGSQTLVAGTNINASHNATTGESEMQVAINPANPLQVTGFTHNVNNLNEMSVFHSSDGGVTWSRTVIDGADDALGSGTRFDPTLQFDANG